MGSSNGTFVGPTRLPLGVPRPLKAGDVVRVADVSHHVRGRVGAPPPAARRGPESTATLARRLVNDLFQSVGGAEVAQVVVGSGPASGQSHALAMPDRPYRIGRSPECDLVLPDDDVSREHAAFERRWQGVFVRDLGSKNGVQIEARRPRRGAAETRRCGGGGDHAAEGGRPRREVPARHRGEGPVRRAAAPAPGGAAGAVARSCPPGGGRRAARPRPPGARCAAAAPPHAQRAPRRRPWLPPRRPSSSAALSREPKAGRRNRREARPRERGSRILPLFVSAFALAVLAGVLYLVWTDNRGHG